MYPESFLWWLGGFAILLGILGLIGMLVLWVNRRLDRHYGKDKEQ